MKKIAFVSLLALACCVADVPETEETAVVTQASHAWGNFHWNTTSGIATVALGNNLSSAWSPSLTFAAHDWNQSTVLDTFVTAGGAGRGCRPTPGRVEVCNAKYGRTGWLGVATVWADSTGRITQATVKLNDTYFSKPPYNTPSWREMVMCQEVGHTYGLDHQDENFSNPNLGTCMDYTSNPAGPPSNEHPNAHDYEELETIYGSDTTPAVAGVRYVHVFPSLEK